MDPFAPVKTFPIDGIRAIEARDKAEYETWQRQASAIDGMPADHRVGEAERLVQRVFERLRATHGEQLVQHHFSINAAKHFYMRLSSKQMRSWWPFHGRRATKSAHRQALQDAFGTEMAFLSRHNAIPLIVLFQREFDTWQSTVYAYIETLRDEINSARADVRYVVKCLNAMEKYHEQEISSRLP